MRSLIIIGLGLCTILLFGCRSISDADVPGEYVAKTDWGNSSLFLAKDHLFEQTVILKSGKVKHLSGKWRLIGPSMSSARSSIDLSPYLNITHDIQGTYAPATFFSISSSLFGRIMISVDPDYGINYYKK
jgi:hypothetical protein